MQSTGNLRKRLYQNLLNKEPKQNHLLGSVTNSKSAILKPKVVQQTMNATAKMSSPVFQKGKLRMQTSMKSPEAPKKIAPLLNQDKLSKQGKAIIEEGKLKSKANLKPHDIFAFYDAFPEMSEDFFYLNRMVHPYDYQIVTYSQRNPLEYMTISFKGVTLYHEKEAEFMTKDEWLEDEKIYYSLQRIEFFKQYKISKNFTIWKNRMRRHYMKEMSNLLNEGLFFSYEHPRSCLLEVRNVTNQLKESIYFMPSNSIQSEESDQFKKNAEDYIQNNFISKVKEIQNLVIEQLQIAINEEIKKFKCQNNIKINDVGEHDQKDHKEGYVYSQQAILRKEYKKVSKLIKLADNIILESKIQLFHNCLLQLIQKIQEVRSSDSKSEWIKCTAQLLENEDGKNEQESSIQWNPTLEGLKNIFKELINLAISKMSDEHEKISMHQRFTKYRSNDENDNKKEEKRNTLKYLIEDSLFYNPLIKKIERYLDEQFQKTKKQEEELVKFITIYKKHKQLPEIKEIFRQHSASEYVQLVREWRQDDVEMHSLPVNKSGGLLIFDYSLLRSTMHEIPKKTLISFLAQLPEETKKKYNELVDESENHLEHINNYPVNMEEFVEFNKAVKKASNALDDLIDGSKSLIQMVVLIEENKSSNHDFNKINPKKAIENINKLKAKVDESNAKYDQSLSHFKKSLEGRISKVQTSVKEYASKFEVIPFDNITSHFTTVLQRLQEIFPAVLKLEQQAQNIQEIQWQLSLPLTEMGEIHNLYKKCIDVKNLWECKQKWNELLIQIQHKHYKEIDCKDLKGKWQEFSRKNIELQKNLPDNEVLKNLIKDVFDFENLLETIASLTSPNLQEKSWREISEYLAYELGVEDEKELPFSNQNDPIYTVRWLIERDISLYKEKISFIVQKSQKEKELQSNLGEFKNFISSIVFDVAVKKREVPLIERNETLQKNLKQKISILYSLVGNQYSDALKNEAEVMIKHYEYMEEILEGMYSFREDWQKYEPFFESNAASAKLLSKESKEFTSWQMQWKKIIKSITNDPTYFYKKICDQTLGVNCSRAIIKSMNKTNMFLDLIKKGIEEFLEKKRTQFPRYCFFTDEELLSILSKVDTRQLIVPELIPILYDNIKSIEYSEEAGSIGSVTVTGYDNHKFSQIRHSAFKSQSEMEDVLKGTEEQIKKVMAQAIKTTFNKYIEEEITRESLLQENNLQVALMVDFIAWVRLAEETYLINEPVGNMKDWLNIQEQQIQEVSTMLKNCPADHYFKYLQFMVQAIYLRQKTVSLAKENVTQTSFYEWERIPKMILTNSQIYLRQLENKVSYNCELLNQKDLVVIQAETERVWINLISAIAAKDGKNVIGINGSNIQILKDLAFYLGQTVKSVKISESCNIKTVQRLITGYMYIGCWMHFMPIKNPEVLSYLAYHITSQKRPNSFQSTSTLQLNKSTMLSNSFSNTIFLFEAGEKLVEQNLIDSKNFRNITLAKPDEKYIMSVLCEAQSIPKEFGQSIVSICEFCRETFDFRKAITHELERSILKQIKQKLLPKFSLSEQNDSQVIDYIVLITVEENIAVYFNDSDKELYQSFKQSYISNYMRHESKFKERLSKKIETENHPVSCYLKAYPNEKKFTNEFVLQATRIYDMLMNKNKFGIILSGQILSGKSEMISFLEKVYRFVQKPCFQFKVSKIYPNAYKITDIIKGYSQQKKERKEKSDKADKNEKQKIEKINEEVGIFQSFLKIEAPQKWIIFDGKIQSQLLEFIQDTFDSLIVPNYGLISKEKFQKQNLQKVKIIIESLDASELSPSLFYNYNVSNINPSKDSVDALVKSFFLNEQIQKYLRSLTKESISEMENTLISNLKKVEQKGNIKSKGLDFLYPFADNQITIKCLKMIECVFRLNQESIREKEKNMKKTIQKFVNWVILMVLYLHVDVESRSKLEKKYAEVCRCEGMFPDSIIKYIVYPSSGIEVHPINGLRTQSSLFQIPERGIITLNTRNDFSDFSNFMNQKTNKFYQEINLETISAIRVNHDESNLFNYYSQLFSYSNQPVVLTGPAGTGKKSILQLYAKNVKHRSFVHSIRYHHNRPLIDIFEKPYRKYNSLDGVILKSVSVTKNIVVFVEDMNLSKEENESLEFLRMLTNDNLFINKNGQMRKLTQENNSLSILSNRVDSDRKVLRVGTRLIFFQTSNNSAQKISSIFSPFLKSWSKANNLPEEVDRIFSSPNGDTLLDATIKVMQFMEETFKVKKSEQKFSLDTILLKSRIGDISKVLSCICLTQEAHTLRPNYYAELWANEIMRVFQDRLSPSSKEVSKQLMELMKKEFFLKFKENFQYSHEEVFIFTSYLSPEQNRFYERIENLDYLQQMIENAYDSQEITVPVKMFFSELLKEVMKIYRVLEITNGHMVLLHLNKKVRQYLIELASQIAKAPFIPLKQNLLTVEKDIIGILQFESDVSVFEDIEDITDEQIYQFTCLLNKNYYDYEMKTDTRERVKNKVSKSIKQMLNDIGTSRETVSQSQKSKIDTIKQKENMYLNQKIEDELETTMQEIFMNNVHFFFGASPTNEKTKRFLLNETDLVGQMHFSFFDIPEESLLQISKNILTLEDDQEEIKDTEQKAQTQSAGKTKEKEQIAQKILSKCMKIYNSLPEHQRNYNCLLCICQNITVQKQKIKKESQKKIEQFSKSIQNFYRAQNLITQNETKLTALQEELETIKSEQKVLKEKLEDKTNQINDLRLNVAENGDGSQEEEHKKLKIKLKTEQIEKIQDEIRQVKMKRDKIEQQIKEARYIIQVSEKYIKVIENVSEIENQLTQEKALESRIEDLLALWWNVILFSSNKNCQQLVNDLNAWMKVIDFQPSKPIENPDDVISTFEVVISPIGTGLTAWESINPENRLKGAILIYTLMYHDYTPSANRIITFYDPSKVYSDLFSYLPADSELGNYSKAAVLHKYDQDFWPELQKHRKGLIFLEETIESREKKEIEAHMIKGRATQINRIVSLVTKREKADVSFVLQKKHYTNFLRLVCLKMYEPAKAAQLNQLRDNYMKDSKKIHEVRQTFRAKRAEMKFDMESDTEELDRLKQEIKNLELRVTVQKSKLKLNDMKVKDDFIITKIMEELFKNENISLAQSLRNKHMMVLSNLQKLFNIVKEKVSRFTSEFREELSLCSKNESHTDGDSLTQSQNVSTKQIEQSHQETEITLEESEHVGQFIKHILTNNFCPSQKVIGEELFNLNLLSLQLEQKVPIIVVENNLLNYSFFTKENRSTNLLYSILSNVLTDSTSTISEDKNGTTNNKTLLFYNDNVHFNVLMELVTKYQEDFRTAMKEEGRHEKKHCIYLFTNSALPLLTRNQYLSNSGYKLFFYQTNSSSTNLSSLYQLNDKSTKTQLYIRLTEYLTKSKFFNNLSEVERYSDFLLSKNWNQLQSAEKAENLSKKELKRYILDISSKILNQEQLLEKVLSEQISFEDINKLVQSLMEEMKQENSNYQAPQQSSQDCLDPNHFEKITEISKTTLEEIGEQLPYLFNTSDFMNPTSKDCLSSEIESLAVKFNKKVKQINYLLEQNLKKYTLAIYKSPSENFYLMPTQAYLKDLNKEYKIIKKLLTLNGLLIGPSPSMGKIVSSKGLNNGIGSQPNLLTKNCMCLENLFFSKRVLNELKIRASKKLNKIPFCRVGLLFALERKSENIIYPSVVQKMINSSTLDITLSVSTTLISGEFKSAIPVTKEQKSSQKRSSMVKPASNKTLRILVIPYDTNSLQQTQNMSNLTYMIGQVFAFTNRKKSAFDTTRKQDNSKDKNSVDITKVKIYLKDQSENQPGQQIGFVEIPSADICGDNLSIVNPKLVISLLDEAQC